MSRLWAARARFQRALLVPVAATPAPPAAPFTLLAMLARLRLTGRGAGAAGFHLGWSARLSFWRMARRLPLFLAAWFLPPLVMAFLVGPGAPPVAMLL